MTAAAGATMAGGPGAGAEGPLAVVCGGGRLPGTVAAAVVASGREVVLFADTIPMMGMLMIPKTCAYVWIVLMGYFDVKKKNRIGEK